MSIRDHAGFRHGYIFDRLRFHLHSNLPRQQPLHQAALLLFEGVALFAEEGEFLVGGVEDGGDVLLFFEGGGEADGFSEEDGGIEDEFLDVDAGAGDAGEADHARGLGEPGEKGRVQLVRGGVGEDGVFLGDMAVFELRGDHGHAP